MEKYNDMREYHAECFKYLMRYHQNHKDFYFVPRERNTKGRLDMNYYFLGDDNSYMMISFWVGRDGNEKIHNINFGIEYGGNCFIEISSNDNEDKAVYLEELISILDKKNKSVLKTFYINKRKNKWRRDYNTNWHYIDILQNFIENEKPIIDEYVSSHPECGIKLADKELHEKLVLKLLKGVEEKENKENTTGEIWVDAHAYRMQLQHNELQNALVKYLENNDNYQEVLKEHNNVDISAKFNNEIIFFELKTSDVRYSIREAVGQLLEYNHYPNVNKADKLIIVTRFEPTEEDRTYLTLIRNTYNLPIYYQKFDLKENILSEEY